MPRLKVFQTHIGLYDWVVAVTSQKAALKAWDVRENLFAQGAAFETQDVRAVELALKNPGVPMAVRGAKGADVIRIAGDEARRNAAARPARPVKAAPKPAPDRSGLDAAEKAARDFARQAARQRSDIERRREAMIDELDAELRRLDAQEKAVLARLARERRKYDGEF